MARAVGLDIGSRMIKVVELSGTPKAFKVQRVVLRPVPEPPPPGAEDGQTTASAEQATAEVVREIFSSLKLPKDDVCAVFDAGTTIFREIQVPFVEEDQIRKVVRFEAENHLHSHSIEDVIVNWVKTGQSKDGSRLTIFASPKSDLKALLDVVRGARVEPSSVDLDATSVYTACEACGVFKEHPNVILIDVGARSTSILLTVDGKPLVLRSFLLGTSNVETDVSKGLEVPLEEGRRRARLPAGPRADDLFVPASSLVPSADTDKTLDEIQGEVAEDVRQTFVRKLHREAMRSLASIQADRPPDRVLLTGGGSLLPGLSEALHEKFDLPIEPLDLSHYVEWKDQGADPSFTQAACPAAVGSALHMLGHNPLGIELLREEFSPTNRFDVIKGALATFVTLLFVVLLGLAYGASQQKKAAQTRYNYAAYKAGTLFSTAETAYRAKVLNEQDQDAKTRVENEMRRMPQDQTRVESYRRLLNLRLQKLQNELGLGDIPQVQSALKVWLEIYRALNKVPRGEYGPWIKVYKLDVKQNSATVGIEVDDSAAFDKVRSQFELSEYFRGRARDSTHVVQVGSKSQQGGHWRSDFDFRFKEEE